MPYNAQQYWQERYKELGAKYVGPINSSIEEVEQRGQVFFEIMRPHLEGCRELVALDFGCGVGRMYPHLAKYCSKYVGTDLFLTDEFKKLTQGHEEVGFTSSIIFQPEDTFDAIFATSVFQHIVGPLEFVEVCGLLRRIAKPNAQVFIIDAEFTSDKMASHMLTRSSENFETSLGLHIHTINTFHSGVSRDKNGQQFIYGRIIK